MRNNDQRIYRSFEEFEREELRRMESAGASVEDMIDTLFGEELDFEAPRSRRGVLDDDDE
jgi:hypothetical protein